MDSISYVYIYEIESIFLNHAVYCYRIKEVCIKLVI